MFILENITQTKLIILKILFICGIILGIIFFLSSLYTFINKSKKAAHFGHSFVYCGLLLVTYLLIFPRDYRIYIKTAQQEVKKIPYSYVVEGKIKSCEYDELNRCVDYLFLKDFDSEENTIHKNYVNYLLLKYDKYIKNGEKELAAYLKIIDENEEIKDKYVNYVLAQKEKENILTKCLDNYKPIIKVK